jgi:hypothetical protein
MSYGTSNIAIGNQAMGDAKVEGHHNVAVGIGALRHLTMGSYNVCIGDEAGADITTESHVIEIGGLRLHDPELAEELVPALRAFIDRTIAEVE